MILVSIAALTFIIRAFPRILLPHVYGSDTYFHLHAARLIRQNGFRLPATWDRLFYGEVYDYPFLYHWLLALFPEKSRLWAERFTGAFFDTCNVVMIYLFTRWLTDEFSLAAGEHIALWAALLFSLSPATLRLSAGPRAYNGSPRVMGQALVMLHTLASFAALTTGHPLAFVVSIVGGALTVTSAKFANQVLLFFAPLFALFFDIRYSLLLLSSVGAAILITRGHAWAILSAQVKHSIFYFKYLQHDNLASRFRSLLTYWNNLKEAVTSRRLGNVVGWYFAETFFSHVLLTVYPHLFLLLFFLPKILSNPSLIQRFMLIWAFAGIICALLTRLPALRFLGESERYLEYSMFSGLFLFAEHALNQNAVFLLYGYLAYSLAAAIYYQYKFNRKFKTLNDNYQTDLALFEALNQRPKGVIQPINIFHWQALYLTQHPVLSIGPAGFRKGSQLIAYEEYKRVFGTYTFPPPDFATVWKEFDIRYLISSPAHLEEYRTKIIHNPTHFDNSVETILASDTIVILEVKKPLAEIS